MQMSEVTLESMASERLTPSGLQAIAPAAEAKSRWTRGVMLATVTIFMIGIGLRVYSAFAFPFDQDELYTIMESRDLFDTVLKPGIEGRPLYYLIQHPLLALPNTEAMLRLLPTIFGVLGLVVTMAAARTLVGPIAGISALLLAALSPWHLYTSGTARYFSLVFLLAGIVTWRLPVAIERDRARDFLIVLITLVVGTATHPSFVFPAAALALSVTLMRREGALRWHWPTRRAWSYLWGPYAAFLVVAYLALKLSAQESALRNWGGRGLLATLRLVPAIFEWTTLPVIALALAGATLLVVSRDARRHVGLMALVTPLVTMLTLFVLSFRTDVYADYAVGMLPVTFVAAGGAVQLLYERLRSGRAAGAVLLLAVGVAGGLPSTVSYLSDGSRFDYRPAFARITREAPQRPVLTWPRVIQMRYAPALRGFELNVPTARRDSLLDSSGQLWAVVSVKRYGIAGDDSGELGQWLIERCRMVESHERPRLDYRLYRVNLWRCDREW
jgi:mannosyltransferase